MGGGIGSIGGVGYTPDALKQAIAMLKAELDDDHKDAPFGVDLLLPQVGGNARKTNKDYTDGNLPELIEIIIKEKAALFICAVGVPPQWAVERLHEAKIPVMNMIGAVKHVGKALDAGVDIICAQGGEGGGHTGDTPTSILLPKVVDAVRGKRSPLTGDDVLVVGAGGIFDGRGLAMALVAGCSAVWVGTRFVASEEAGAGPMHKKRIVNASYDDTMRTTIYTGRPMRIFKTPYTIEYETDRVQELVEMQAMGLPPFVKDVEGELEKGLVGVGIFHSAEVRTVDEKQKGVELSVREKRERGVYLTGQCAGAITDVKSAKEIIEEMVAGAVVQLNSAVAFIDSKL